MGSSQYFEINGGWDRFSDAHPGLISAMQKMLELGVKLEVRVGQEIYTLRREGENLRVARQLTAIVIS